MDMELGLEDIIFFESDDEFADFAIAPFATIDENSVISTDYSTQYKESINQGKKFVIMNGSFKSRVNANGKIAKKVPLNIPGKTRYTGVTVNVTNYGEIALYMCEITYKGNSMTTEPIDVREAGELLSAKLLEVIVENYLLKGFIGSVTEWNYREFKTLLELIRKDEYLNSDFEIIQHLVFVDWSE